jgi:hypothetical protein
MGINADTRLISKDEVYRIATQMIVQNIYVPT